MVKQCDRYRTALIPTVAMMVNRPHADSEIRERWFQRLAEHGVGNGAQDDKGLIGYLGQIAKGTGRKRTQLTEEFI